MKKTRKSNVVAVSEAEYNKLLQRIAVENGLRTPQTPEEVDVFEEVFAQEIAKAHNNRPGLSDILSIARDIKNSGAPVVEAIEKTVVDARYRMAARNGNEINEETEDLMDKAIQKAKEKRKND